MPGSAGIPEDSAEGSADGLFTAEDLFGDLVDAPPEASAARPASRSGPVKVQIAEKNRPAEAAPPTAEVPPEEMAALIDAFDAPVPERAHPPSPAPVKSPSPASPKAASPIAAGGAEVDALLNTLGAMEAAEPEPEPTQRRRASACRGHGQPRRAPAQDGRSRRRI